VWYQVSVGGTTGWVMGQYLAQAKAPAQSQPAAPAQPAVMSISGFAKVANTDGDPLRVRSAASRSGSVITTLAPGASVVVKQGPQSDKENIAWYQISANGKTGWVMGQYLTQAKAPAEPAAAVKPVSPAPAPAPAAPVAPAQPQPAPAAEAPAAPVAPAAQEAPAAPAAKEEPRTGAARGAEQPQAVASSSKSDAIVGTAMKYVGYRYRFGGTSPAGFDCSGFVFYVCNTAGVKMGRNMSAQLNSGTRISSKDLQPGDLVFFSNTYKRGLSHAGIYIGNGKFVHAQNERTGVVVSNLWSSYWAAHYTAAVRPGR
jgi:cell wall-associated NlpC family hydrolase